jgi:hypothetical protein
MLLTCVTDVLYIFIHIYIYHYCISFMGKQLSTILELVTDIVSNKIINVL